MIELYVKVSSIDNTGDSLNNLPEISNRTDNNIPSTINLVHQIHEPDPQRALYPTPFSPNATSENPMRHSPIIIDDTEIKYTHNENNDVLEEDERNDDDFIPVSTDG
jgi:hypothetical protein